LDSYRDWGHAEDYVKAMHAMLQQQKPQDLVIATGESYTVREFVDAAFKVVDKSLNYNDFIVIDPKFYRPAEVDYLEGRATKARQVLGWKPEVSFHQLVTRMVESDLRNA
jgi:GDPmannose 4,6-dehydratase